MKDPFAENRERIAAANSLLDRGHGKPLTAVISLPSTRAHQAMLAALSDEELMAQINQTQLPRIGTIPIQAVDAEFAEVPDPLLR